jgi:hypothetical protein
VSDTNHAVAEQNANNDQAEARQRIGRDALGEEDRAVDQRKGRHVTWAASSRSIIRMRGYT